MYRTEEWPSLIAFVIECEVSNSIGDMKALGKSCRLPVCHRSENMIDL